MSESALSDQLVDELQRRIFSGDIPVGSWLRHAALAEDFGVSRTPVREALRVLGAQGIVTIVQNRGARVNGHSARDIRELGTVRAELEGLAAELAAEHIDDRQLARLRNAWAGFRTSGTELNTASATETATDTATDTATASGDDTDRRHRWAEAHDEFHSVILEASGNRQLALALADMGRRLPRNAGYSAYAGNSRVLRQIEEQHEAIIDAIGAGDTRRARTAMRRHILASAQVLARWIEAQQGIEP
ncbi:GntR family transcriptional regulator [Amycolatopsis rhabdoformis]|uniref:GntR family transcriptional regulator n=1 Tax=Amycolatopsis rhabdoformis TaxID=1448059 RepID=A0ABZ1HUZ9_9PSEU|nr:GntR family transcriptional regulator [Amycolatopsis rhabdoformis]WSE26167.1 GntR family transcriptional regulator [Amycolatopsis rhabdoformis]